MLMMIMQHGTQIILWIFTAALGVRIAPGCRLLNSASTSTIVVAGPVSRLVSHQLRHLGATACVAPSVLHAPHHPLSHACT